MAHYFENNEDLISKEKKVQYTVNQQSFTVLTDYGVFSKKGLDFGTRSLLENLDVNQMTGKILDFGCGYGPIGIYIAKHTKAEVHMVDINLRSLALAKKNSELNQVKTKIYESNIYENISDTFDFIISNPPIRVGKKILYTILFEAKTHLKKNGELWIVIHKDQGAKSLVKDLENEYKVEIKQKNKGFYIIRAINC